MAQRTSSLGRRAAILALKCVVAALLLGWLLHSGRLDLSTLFALQANWPLAGVFVCKAGSIFLPLVRWRSIVAARGLRLRLASALHIGAIGGFFSLLTPGPLGMDGAKVFYATRANPRRAEAVISTVVLDRLIGFFALVVLAIFFGSVALLQGFPPAVARPLLFTTALMLAALLAAALVMISPKALPSRRAATAAARLQTELREYTRRRRALVKALALALIIHICTILAVYLAFRVLGFSPPLLTVCAIAPLVVISGVLPLTPMGLGVTDSVAEILYGAVGMNGGAEAAMTVRIATLLLYLLAGMAYLVPVAVSHTDGGAPDTAVPDAGHDRDIAQPGDRGRASDTAEASDRGRAAGISAARDACD